jgi:predicted amidohydrolase YtcJ
MSRVLFTGGPIVTFGGPPVSSLAIDGDRIVAIGAEAASWSASFDQVVHLGGRAVIPAFRDGHAHPLHAERAALQDPIATIAQLGAAVSFGSDWPVSSHRPLDGLAVAVTRQNANGEPVDGWLPEERIPILQAIHAYSAGSAFQAFDDDAGALTVGSRADVVVLDRDITAIPGAEVAGAAADETWMNGVQVFRRSAAN